MNDIKKRILSLTVDDLEEIEVELSRNLKSHLGLVKDVASHILFSGGKRLRPLLVVLCARICGYSGNYDKKFSTIFEYLHTATLLHDDLIDEAKLRRGKEVANTVWNNSIAVLTGDFLLARSLSLAVETKIPKIIKIIATITEDMSQGEIQQLINKGKLDLTEDEYMTLIERKTSVLIKGACYAGATLANCTKEEGLALEAYGNYLGIAFQMADDLLDYTSDVKSLGKEPGADLREGKLTLPIIKALEKADDNSRKIMQDIILNKNFSYNDFDIFLKMLIKFQGISYTKEAAEKNIIKAKNELEIFRPSETKNLLIMIADYALTRKN